jgi:hypothetical protein
MAGGTRSEQPHLRTAVEWPLASAIGHDRQRDTEHAGIAGVIRNRAQPRRDRVRQSAVTRVAPLRSIRATLAPRLRHARSPSS